MWYDTLLYCDIQYSIVFSAIYYLLVFTEKLLVRSDPT